MDVYAPLSPVSLSERCQGAPTIPGIYCTDDGQWAVSSAVLVPANSSLTIDYHVTMRWPLTLEEGAELIIGPHGRLSLHSTLSMGDNSKLRILWQAWRLAPTLTMCDASLS